MDCGSIAAAFPQRRPQPPLPARDGWGHLPVWGFGHVADSSHPDLDAGMRVYGYFPLASWLTVGCLDEAEGLLRRAVSYPAEMMPVQDEARYLSAIRRMAVRFNSSTSLANFSMANASWKIAPAR